TAGRIYKGQQNGRTGEEEKLHFENFPHAGLVKTYSTDAQTDDSASTATSVLCGVKTKKGVIGIDDRVTRASCLSWARKDLQGATERQNRRGRKTTL
uniref:alkaline phosphatase n=1 Tax=Salmonella sp. s55044 TaxID=3159677 RepID=UPI00398125EA